jgi:hypothetical protein
MDRIVLTLRSHAKQLFQSLTDIFGLIRTHGKVILTLVQTRTHMPITLYIASLESFDVWEIATVSGGSGHPHF